MPTYLGVDVDAGLDQGRPSIRVLVLAEDALGAESMVAVLCRSQSVKAECQVGYRALNQRLINSPQDVVVWYVNHADTEELERLDSVRRNARVPLCIVAASVDPGALHAAFLACPGGLAVLLRGMRTTSDDLFRTLAQLVAGRAVLSGPVFAGLLRTLESQPGDALAQLSATELEVLELLSLGLRNAAIARRLQRSEKGIEKLVGRIFAKLRLEDGGERLIDRRVMAARVFLGCPQGVAEPIAS